MCMSHEHAGCRSATKNFEARNTARNPRFALLAGIMNLLSAVQKLSRSTRRGARLLVPSRSSDATCLSAVSFRLGEILSAVFIVSFSRRPRGASRERSPTTPLLERAPHSQ